MKTTGGIVGLLALLFVCLVFSSCQSGPSAADVAADRDRWIAVRDVTADDVIDKAEKPVFSQQLSAWDTKLAADERAVAQADTTVQDLVRVYGAAAVQVWLGPELEKRSPELFLLVDRNGDHVLSADELQAVDPKSPVFALVVMSTAAHLLARK